MPLRDLPDALRRLAYLLPLTYANDALRGVMIKRFDLAEPAVVRDSARSSCSPSRRAPRDLPIRREVA
jgi:hypothetical protein